MEDADTEGHEVPTRRRSSGEHRGPAIRAVVVAALSYALLDQRLLFAPRLLIPVVEVALALVIFGTTTTRISARSRFSRWGTVVLAGVVIATNLVALAMLVRSTASSGSNGISLLIGGMQVWLTNVIGFALLYWELDRGGPVARRELRRDRLPAADWRFSQDENAEAVTEVARTASKNSGWIPLFVDYLYLSVTNSSAFSPTDTMPLSTRAKSLMALQATAALLVSLLVVARAVGSLGS